MNKKTEKKLSKKVTAPVKNAEIKKEGEGKMKNFSIFGGVKNAWRNHKNGFKNVAIVALGATCIYLALRGPKVEVRYEQLPPVEVIVEVPAETATEENNNNVRN